MTDRKNSGEWHPGRALDASGKLVGGAPAAKPQAFAPPPEEKLELELDTSRMRKPGGAYEDPGAYREDETGPRRRRTALKAIAILAVLGVAAAVAFVRIPFLHAFRLQGAAKPLLVVSNPSGALVRINGAVVGVTPFAIDNHYVGKVKVELQLEGYEPFTETFVGGGDAQVAATLRKKP